MKLKDFDFDFENENPYIKIPDLKDGYLYEIDARNARIGIWIEKRKSFIISRFKFGSNYIFEENHYDYEYFPTAKPLSEIEKAPFITYYLKGYIYSKNDSKYWAFMCEDLLLRYLNKKDYELFK